MPNHCQNILAITGAAHFIAIFKQEAHQETWTPKEDFMGDKLEPLELQHNETVFSFNKFVPMPPHLRQRVSPNKDGLPTWYDWAQDNWDTKWGAYDAIISSEEEGKIVYKFNTAWSPPYEFLKRLSNLFPMLSFGLLWHEEGGSYGSADFSSGNTFNETEGSQKSGHKDECPLCGSTSITLDDEDDEYHQEECGDCGMSWSVPSKDDGKDENP